MFPGEDTESMAKGDPLRIMNGANRVEQEEALIRWIVNRLLQISLVRHMRYCYSVTMELIDVLFLCILC